MADNKRIAKNTLFLYFRMFLIMGVQLYTSRMVLKILGVEDFGLYNIVGGVVVMFSFLNGGLSAATSRFITFELGKKDYIKLNKIFNVTLITHVGIAFIVVVLAETVGLWFFYNKMTIPEARLDAVFWVYQISVLTAVFSLTQVPYTATIIAHENMKIYAYVGIVDAILRLLIVFLLYKSPMDKLILYALLLFLLQVGIMFFYRFYCRKYQECSIMLCKDRSLYKDIFSYAGSDMIGSISVMAQGQGLNLLLNIFFGPAVNAARAIAYQLQGAITQFSTNFFTAVRPQIIKLYAEGKNAEMLKLVKHSSWFSYYLMLIISLPVCFEADFILKMWLGEYPAHTNSFLVLVIILCLIQTLKTPRTTVFHATGRILLVNIVVGSILCSVFPLAYLFLKLGGSPESVFWAANITMLLSELVSVFILKKYINYSIVNYLLNVHGRCFLVSLITAVILYYFTHTMESGFIRVILTCVISTISILAVGYAIGINNAVRNKVRITCGNKIKQLRKK